MKKLAKLCAFNLILLASQPSWSQPRELTISQADRVYHLSRLWSAVKYNFVNFDQIKFDADSLYRTYLAEALVVKSDYAYMRLLKRFMAAWGDGHTGLTFGRRDYLLEGQVYVPLNLSYLEDGLYITCLCVTPVHSESMLGAKIIKIDGIPTEQYLKDSIFPYISASTEHYRRIQCQISIVNGYPHSPLNITIKQRDGVVKDVSIPRNQVVPSDVKVVGIPNSHRLLSRPVFFANLNDDISYMMVQTFAYRSVCDDIYKYVSQINSSKGLIIDLRRNGGGITDVAWFLQSLLTPEGTNHFMSYISTVRVNDGVKMAWSNWKEDCKPYGSYSAFRHEPADSIMISDTLTRIKVPVVILIGPETYSAAEDFLVCMKEVPNRPIFIGEETGGSTGLPMVVDGLPHGAVARICTHRISFPYSRKPFVGTGIEPDIWVKESIDDYLGLTKELFPIWPKWEKIEEIEQINLQMLPRDVVVQAAIRELKKNMN